MDGSEKIVKGLSIYPENLDIRISNTQEGVLVRLESDLGGKFRLIREALLPSNMKGARIDSVRTAEGYLGFIADLYAGNIGKYWIEEIWEGVI